MKHEPMLLRTDWQLRQDRRRVIRRHAITFALSVVFSLVLFAVVAFVTIPPWAVQ